MGSGSLAIVTFSAIGAGDSAVTLDAGQLVDTQTPPIAIGISAENAQITVQDPSQPTSFDVFVPVVIKE